MRGEYDAKNPDDLFAMPSLLAAAHELKAPLVLMRQLAFEIEAQQGETDASRRLRFTSERSLRLVSNLTKSARLEDSLFELEPVEIHSLCRDVAHEMSPLAKEYGQRITVDMPKTHLVSVAHKDLLHAVLIGLCDNALAHNSKGKNVTLGARIREGRIHVSVRDHGPRMSLTELRGLKGKIGKGAMPISSRPRSSGLGLWIASQFAHAMSATIGSTSHRSKEGMSFFVSLSPSTQLSLFD